MSIALESSAGDRIYRLPGGMSYIGIYESAETGRLAGDQRLPLDPEAGEGEMCSSSSIGRDSDSSDGGGDGDGDGDVEVQSNYRGPLDCLDALEEVLPVKDYDAESERQEGVENFYRINHINQSYDFVKKMREEYGKLDKVEMSIWECCELLNDVVDESDPDLDEPQIEHLLQTAEAIRKDYPNEEWLHLTALIH
ncbi:hypothetical protein RJ640_024963, partial [Escallonia rubra]